MLISYGIAGFGLGTIAIVALGTSAKNIPDNPGLGFSLPGFCISLSLGFLVFVVNQANKITVDTPTWSYDMFVIAGSLTVFFVSSFLIFSAVEVYRRFFRRESEWNQ